MNTKKKNGILFQIPKVVLMVLFALISGVFFILYCHICVDQYSLGMFVRTFITVAISFLVWFGLTKITGLLEKNYRLIVAVFLGIMLILQIIFGYFLEITPQWDFANIYQGAISWAETGQFPNPDDYFYLFPNNLGGMAFMALLFKLTGIFGIHNYSMTAMTANAILNVLMMLVVFCICKRLLSVRSGIFALYIFMVSLPSYFGAAVFYTDVLTMLFPVLLYYLYLRFRDAKDQKWKIAYLILMGLDAWVGMSIKFTVFIVAIAIAIELILRLEWKRLLACVAAVAAVYFICNACFYHVIYADHLDQETAERMKLPPAHWIMMGLQGNADYSAEDTAFSRSFSSPEMRNDALADKIKERISDYGPSGLYDLATRKGVKCFCDGTYELSAFFFHGMAKDTFLNDYITSDGAHFESYQKFCSGIFLGFVLIMILGGFYKIYECRHTPVSQVCLTPWLAVFGLLLFLLMWEAHARYITNFIPMIYVCAAISVEGLSRVRVKFSVAPRENSDNSEPK